MPNLRINGRRGVIQLLLAGVWLGLGYDYARPQLYDRGHTLFWLAEIMPVWIIGALWIVGGISAVIGSFRTRPRDSFAFQALAFAPAALAVANFIGWIFNDHTEGFGIGIRYIFIAAFVIVLAGMQGDTDRDARGKP